MNLLNHEKKNSLFWFDFCFKSMKPIYLDQDKLYQIEGKKNSQGYKY